MFLFLFLGVFPNLILMLVEIAWSFVLVLVKQQLRLINRVEKREWVEVDTNLAGSCIQYKLLGPVNDVCSIFLGFSTYSLFI